MEFSELIQSKALLDQQTNLRNPLQAFAQEMPEGVLLFYHPTENKIHLSIPDSMEREIGEIKQRLLEIPGVTNEFLTIEPESGPKGDGWERIKKEVIISEKAMSAFNHTTGGALLGAKLKKAVDIRRQIRTKHIQKSGSGYDLRAKHGSHRVLGHHKTKKEAIKQEAIEIAKHGKSLSDARSLVANWNIEDLTNGRVVSDALEEINCPYVRDVRAALRTLEGIGDKNNLAGEVFQWLKTDKDKIIHWINQQHGKSFVGTSGKWQPGDTAFIRTSGSAFTVRVEEVKGDKVLVSYFYDPSKTFWTESSYLVGRDYKHMSPFENYKNLPTSLSKAFIRRRDKLGRQVCFQDGVHTACNIPKVAPKQQANRLPIVALSKNKEPTTKKESSKSSYLSSVDTQSLYRNITKDIDTSGNITEESKEVYKKRIKIAVKYLPKKAIQRIAQNMEKVEFYKDYNALTKGTIDDIVAHVSKNRAFPIRLWYKFLGWIVKNSIVMGGAYCSENKKLYLDGSLAEMKTSELHHGDYALNTGRFTEDMNEQLYVHELTHVIDGPKFEISNSPEWIDAWQSELFTTSGGTAALSVYAQSMTEEGFAEFGRVVFTDTVALREIEKRFPKCSQVFKKRGLWPKRQ